MQQAANETCRICLESCCVSDLRLKCRCILHSECPKRYILTELGNFEAIASRGGITCPKYFAGSCVSGDQQTFIGPKYLETLQLVDETFKLARWLREAKGSSSGSDRGHKSTGGSCSTPIDEATATFIEATSKLCPGILCGNRETHFHGHSCHHVFGGCTQCKTQYCYRCLCTADENLQIRGDKKSCKCGFWSNFCKPLRTAEDIDEHLMLEPYPHDRRCGCPICSECRPNTPCGTCPGDCAVCEGWLQPGPSQLNTGTVTIPWVAQNERQLKRSRDEGREMLRLLTTGITRTLDVVHLVFFDQCRTGDVVEVARTLDAGVIDVDTQDPADGGKTVLMVAGERAHVEVVRLLLERHASPNIQERIGGHTELHLICRHGRVDAEHIEVVRLLLHFGADPNIAGRFDITPLHRACYNRSIDLLCLLIEGGSDIHRQERQHRVDGSPKGVRCGSFGRGGSASSAGGGSARGGRGRAEWLRVGAGGRSP